MSLSLAAISPLPGKEIQRLEGIGVPGVVGLDLHGVAQRMSPHLGTQTSNGQAVGRALAERAQHGGWVGVWAISTPVTPLPHLKQTPGRTELGWPLQDRA